MLAPLDGAINSRVMPSGLHHGIERRLVESPGLWAWNGNREYAFGEPANAKTNGWTASKVREIREVQQ